MTGTGAFKAGLVLSVFALWPVVASAADCSVEKAVYEEPDAGFSLQFQPASAESSPLSHRFGVGLDKAGLKLDGHVMYDEESARPMGMVLHNCPEGDVTGADLRACTVWQGVVYAIDGAGAVDILPPEGSAAPASLLLPGFGPGVRQSAIWGKAGKVPWDVFAFKGCAS